MSEDALGYTEMRLNGPVPQEWTYIEIFLFKESDEAWQVQVEDQI